MTGQPSPQPSRRWPTGWTTLGGVLLGALAGALSGEAVRAVPLTMAAGLALGVGIDSLLNWRVNEPRER